MPENRAIRHVFDLLRLGGFALGYWGLIAITRSSTPEDIHAVIRPAEGLLVAVLFVSRVRNWPVLVVVGTLVDHGSARSHPRLEVVSSILPLINSATAIANAALLRRLIAARRTADDFRELLALVLVSTLVSVLFATVAAAFWQTLLAGLATPNLPIWQRWVIWTAGTFLGAMIVTPAALTSLTGSRFRARLRPILSLGRGIELMLLTAGIVILTLTVFRDAFVTRVTLIEVSYLLLPCMIWMVLRYDFRFAMAIWMAVALFASWSTQNGEGPFAGLGGDTYQRVLPLQKFLCVSTLSLLAVGAVLLDRRRKAEALLESELRYRAVVEDQTELIVRALPDGTVTFVNDAVCRVLGVSKSEIIGEPWPGLLEDGNLMGLSPENPTVSREGCVGTAWFQWTDRALYDNESRLLAFQSVGRDITALKRAREELTLVNTRLQTLSTRLLQAQEDERRAIARELHDEVGQNLTALKIDLVRLRRKIDDPVTLERLDDTSRLADHALQEVRNLSQDLRPSMLDDFGLVAALRWYVDRQAARAGFAGVVTAPPTKIDADPAVETACYRIAQEAITNVLKYATAMHVDVTLSIVDRRLVVEIRDDGAGFDVPKALERASHGGSVGLLSMRERATLAGGELTIESAPGHGTRVVADLPLLKGESG